MISISVENNTPRSQTGVPYNHLAVVRALTGLLVISTNHLLQLSALVVASRPELVLIPWSRTPTQHRRARQTKLTNLCKAD